MSALYDDENEPTAEEWEARHAENERRLWALMRDADETWDDYARRILTLRRVVGDNFRHLVRRKVAEAGTLQASVTTKNGVRLVPLGAQVEHEARMAHPDVRAEMRQRLAPILATGRKVKCTCHRSRPEWRRCLWEFEKDGVPFRVDSEGASHPMPCLTHEGI